MEKDGNLPEETDESLWDEPGGESPDGATSQMLNIAHQAIDKFPELSHRYRRFAGPAAVVSTALIVLTGIAVARRTRKGQTYDKILEELTEDEIENAASRAQRANQWRRKLLKMRRKKDAGKDGED